MLCRAGHALFCATERILEPRRGVVTHPSQCPVGRKELVQTSRFVRVTCDLEDQSEQAQDRNKSNLVLSKDQVMWL